MEQSRAVVSPSTLGAWVVKCNPRLTDPAELAEGGVARWCVAPNYRRRLMAAGQPVLLWVTGSRPLRYRRGFWALGTLTGPAADEGTGGPTVPLNLEFFATPVEAGEVAASAGLADIEVLRQPQMANPSFLTTDQWRRLQPLLPG
jgi:hypothetical protein